MVDVFRTVKEEVIKREIPVYIAWELRDMDNWRIEYVEKSSGCHFQVAGNSQSSVSEIVKIVEHHVISYKRRHKENGPAC